MGISNRNEQRTEEKTGMGARNLYTRNGEASFPLETNSKYIARARGHMMCAIWNSAAVLPFSLLFCS